LTILLGLAIAAGNRQTAAAPKPTPTPVSGITADLYVANSNGKNVAIFNKGSNGLTIPIANIAVQTIGNPTAISLDSHGNIYVTTSVFTLVEYAAGSKSQSTGPIEPGRGWENFLAPSS
jgi:hypothetical protein